MAIFACSFDAGSPLAGWTTATGVGIVTGRTSNGGSIVTSLLEKTFSGVSSCCFASAWTNGLAGVMVISGTSGQFITNTINVIGDGRLKWTIASILGSEVFTPSTQHDGTIQGGLWNYYENFVTVTTYSVVDNGDGTSTVHIVADVSLYIDNHLVLSGTYDKTAIVANANIPTNLFSKAYLFGIGFGGVVDDIYIDTARLGDSEVSSNDTTITQVAGNLHLTQALLENARHDANQLRLTSHLIENVRLHTNQLRATSHLIEIAITSGIKNRAYIQEA